MTAPITAPGLYTVPAADYHADRMTPAPSLSSSGARRIMNECPAVFWHERNNPPAPSKALDVGSAAHEWLLEGESWPQRFVVLPEDHNGATKEGKARVAAIEADGKRPLRHDDFETIKAMRDALAAHPFAAAAFEDGRAELSLYWQDAEFGIWCRARPDFLPNRHAIVADYKTTRSAHPDHIRKAMVDYGYHAQAEWYLGGIRALGLIEAPRFLFVFQEKTAPYLVTCVTPGTTALEWAAMQNRKARETFARCLDHGAWPGYADDILTLELPVWAEMKLQERSGLGHFEIAPPADEPPQ